MSHPIISVENLSKAYRLGLKEEVPDTFVGAMTGWLKAPVRNWKRLKSLNTFNEPVANGALAVADDNTASPQANGQPDDILWALRDVSFEVHEGEVVGIIGRNGAGKSTLLKILSRITEPTHGRAVIRGRVSSLLEVGTGFHPELTGRENIYMNGTILGMRKKEIDKKFDEIVDFSGVEKFLDTPIKRYSSGMQVRLAFAVAAHLEPEILIIDEVLAVGDAEFQKKCLGKMQDVAKGGRTVLFVSHNMAAVESLCSRGVWIDGGRLKLECETSQVIAKYHDQSVTASRGSGHRFRPINDLNRILRPDFHVEELRITSARGFSAEGYRLGDPLTIELDCLSSSELTAPVFMFSIRTKFGQVIADFHSSRAGAPIPPRPSGPFSVACTIPHLHLVPGEYLLRLAIKSSDQWFFVSESAGVLSIMPADFFGTGKPPCPSNACVVCEQTWSFSNGDKMPTGISNT